MDYKTIANDGIVEEEIKKSRFICHLKRISNEVTLSKDFSSNCVKIGIRFKVY